MKDWRTWAAFAVVAAAVVAAWYLTKGRPEDSVSGERSSAPPQDNGTASQPPVMTAHQNAPAAVGYSTTPRLNTVDNGPALLGLVP